jgi:hypothetical protein
MACQEQTLLLIRNIRKFVKSFIILAPGQMSGRKGRRGSSATLGDALSFLKKKKFNEKICENEVLLRLIVYSPFCQTTGNFSTTNNFFDFMTDRAQGYKLSMSVIFVISLSVCPWQAFLA